VARNETSGTKQREGDENGGAGNLGAKRGNGKKGKYVPPKEILGEEKQRVRKVSIHGLQKKLSVREKRGEVTEKIQGGV